MKERQKRKGKKSEIYRKKRVRGKRTRDKESTVCLASDYMIDPQEH